MAYNKTKYVDAALKFLHQGKLAQAIGEYQQILKHEPKDQITLMTVGDLFVRQGDTFQALEYFERLAQLYLADGFVTKAIAIYKKIAKLAPEETRPVEKLAELYVQQGVLSEARPIYLQLADMHQRAGRAAQAATLLRKLLDAEPDNLRAQTKLAEVCLSAGMRGEAAGAYVAAARQLLSRGDHAEAIKNVDRALEIEPANSAATALKVRIHAASGQQKQAIAMLESAPDLDQGGESATLLLDLYLEGDQTSEATDLASKIFARNPKQFAPALRVVNMFLAAGDADRVLLLLDMIREAMTDAGEHESLSQALTQAAERFPERIEPLQWLVELYGRTSDTFRLPDALANLAKAHEAAGRCEEALKAWEQLLDRDPEKESVRKECDRLRALSSTGEKAPQAEPDAPSPIARGRPPRRPPPMLAQRSRSPQSPAIATATDSSPKPSPTWTFSRAMDSRRKRWICSKPFSIVCPAIRSLWSACWTSISAPVTRAAPPRSRLSSNRFTRSAAIPPRPTASRNFAAGSIAAASPRRPHPCARCKHKSSRSPGSMLNP